MSELVRIERATRRFGTFTAVDSVSIRVEAGEIVGLLGANGAGKTTVIRMILGLLTPTAGRILLFGQPPSRRVRKELGYVAQGLGLYADLTVQENLAFVAEAFGTGAPPSLPPGLRGSEGRLVSEIGWGLQRQLAFTAALGHRPRLLVLDEPTSGVDPLARARLWDTIHQQADSGTGVLVTTHYMQEAQQCDRLVLMSKGRQVASGNERDIIGSTTAVEVCTSRWAEAFDALSLAGLPATLAGRNVRVADTAVELVRRALERAGVRGTVREVPATLEEKLTVIG